MQPNASLTHANLTTPRAAAIAGLLFSALLIGALALLWISIPVDPRDPGAWLVTSLNRVEFALSLMPFAGIAFLWFVAVLRDRLGESEDRFFATVFLGSGLLFLAMLFVASAILAAIITAYEAMPSQLLNSETFVLARAFAFNIMNVYAIKMAGVFMAMTSTLGIRTGFVARWIALLGYPLALLLLFGNFLFDLNLAIFPLWVLVISGYILIDNFRQVQTPLAENASG